MTLKNRNSIKFKKRKITPEEFINPLWEENQEVGQEKEKEEVSLL